MVLDPKVPDVVAELVVVMEVSLYPGLMLVEDVD